MDIIQFIRDPMLINDQTLSVPQEVALRSFYGLPLVSDEMVDFHRRFTGLEQYRPREFNEALFLCGRRSGKSDRLAGNIACFEAVEGRHNDSLSPGEVCYYLCVSVNKRNAQLVLSYIKAKFRNSPVLSAMVEAEYAEELHLKGDIRIACYPASYKGLRGFSVAVAICDELAFWSTESMSGNVDTEILNAIRPAQATFPNPKIVKITTPWLRAGEVWHDYERYFAKPESQTLVWVAPTKAMNPSISDGFLEREQSRDPEAFEREYNAVFSSSISEYIPADAISLAVVKNRQALPYDRACHYVASLDAAFKNDNFVLCICHVGEEGKIVFDYMQTWRGSRKNPLQSKPVVADICRTLREYKVHTIWGDQFASVPLAEIFQEHSVQFLEYTYTNKSKSELFNGFRHRLLNGQLELLDHAQSLKELRSLEMRKLPSGNYTISAPNLAGYSDDHACALALCAHQCKTHSSVLSGITHKHLFRLGASSESSVSAG